MPEMPRFVKKIRTPKWNTKIPMSLLLLGFSISTEKEKEAKTALERLCLEEAESHPTGQARKQKREMDSRPASQGRGRKERSQAWADCCHSRHNILESRIRSNHLSFSCSGEEYLVGRGQERNSGHILLRTKDSGGEGLVVLGRSCGRQTRITNSF